MAVKLHFLKVCITLPNISGSDKMWKNIYDHFNSTNVGHFGHGHFGLGCFGPDILATDVSATENAKGGRFGQNHKLWVGVFACINV